MRRDLLIILLFAGMVFLFLSCFGILGPVGNLFRSLMFGLAGFSAYFLPVFVFGAVLYYTAHENDPMMPARLTGACGLFLVFSPVCELVSADLKNMPLYDLSGIYNRCSSSGKGGGIVGGSIAYFLHHWFKFAGAVLILLILAAVCIVLISRESVIDAVGAKAAEARTRSRERREYLEQLREEEEQYRLEHPEEFPEEFEEPEYPAEEKFRDRSIKDTLPRTSARKRKKEKEEYRYTGIVGDTRLDGYPQSGPILQYEIGPDGRADAFAPYPEQEQDPYYGSTASAQQEPYTEPDTSYAAQEPEPIQDSYMEQGPQDTRYEYSEEYPSEEYPNDNYAAEEPQMDRVPLSEGDRLDPIGYQPVSAAPEKAEKRTGFFGRHRNTPQQDMDLAEIEDPARKKLRRAGDIHEITVEDYLDDSYDTIQPVSDTPAFEDAADPEDPLSSKIRMQSAMGVIAQNEAEQTAQLIGGIAELTPPAVDTEVSDDRTDEYEDIPYIPNKILTFDRRGHAVSKKYADEQEQFREDAVVDTPADIPVNTSVNTSANISPDIPVDTRASESSIPYNTVSAIPDSVVSVSDQLPEEELFTPNLAEIPNPVRSEGQGIVMDPVETDSAVSVPFIPAAPSPAVSTPAAAASVAAPVPSQAVPAPAAAVTQSYEAVQARQDAANATINAGGLKGTDSSQAAASDALTVIDAEQGISVPGTTVQNTPSRPRFQVKDYVYPPLDLLVPSRHDNEAESENELRETAARLQMTLKTFGVNVKITDISQGPAVTRYELLPELGVKVSKIVGLQDDIKLQLAATDIRIEAPIPGKSAIGIEVPNKTTSIVALRDILETQEFQTHKSRLAFGVGKDIAGKSVITDIAKMPHVLIAGSTGSGKSVCINTIIMSILYHADPKEVKLIMIDPKVVELSVYNGIPHLMIPVVTNPQKASAALNWAVAEMDSRYRKFADSAVRDIKGYNALVKEREDAIKRGVPEDQLPGTDDMQFMPQLVVIVDELADLMMVAKNDVETAICRLAQLARAAGIHLIIATQRPSVDVITGLIKANMPSRIAFAVSSGVDSRTILDMYGAEKLLGKGDMLFFPQGMTKPARVQGAFVSDDEVNAVVHFIKENNAAAENTDEIEKKIENLASGGPQDSAQETAQEVPESRFDELFEKAGKFIIEKNNASIGLLQRMYRIGFNRAARIMDQLCEAGVVGEAEGTKSRRILMTEMEFENFCRENEL